MISCISLALAVTMHIGLENNYNSIHPHARCTVDKTIVGVYYNSERTVSAYAGYIFDTVFDAQVEVGIVTGYSGAKVAPLFRVIKDNWFITPAYETKPRSNVGITIGYEFKY